MSLPLKTNTAGVVLELAEMGPLGDTRPAKFPVVRIDQILVRGVEPESSWVLPATGSDHLPGGGRYQLVSTHGAVVPARPVIMSGCPTYAW